MDNNKTLYDELWADKSVSSDDFNIISLNWERDLLMKYIRNPSSQIEFVWNKERGRFEL